MKRKSAKFELILLFERFKYQPKVMFEKLKKQGYSRATVYRYYHHWEEADNLVKVLQKEL